MPVLQFPLLDPDQGTLLTRDEYAADFDRWDAAIEGRDSYKLERRQHFQEPDEPSWVAFQRGDWSEAMRLLDEVRPQLLAAAEEDNRRGTVFRRTRIVEDPLTPYMRWELEALLVQSDCGKPVRVVHADELRDAEAEGPLPELVVLGGRVLFQVLYNDDGVHDGAVRFTEPETVARCERYLARLHDTGENLRPYFGRCVARLPPPGPGTAECRLR